MAGRFDQIDFLKQPRGGQSQYAFEVTSNAIFGELHVQRQLSGLAGIRGGATLMRDLDLESERWLVTPSLAFVLTF